MNTHGIILAAGGSTRMGVPKALLPIRGIPLIRLHTTTLHPFCRSVRVVLGAWAAELDAALPASVDRVHNPDWATTGPAESLLRAIQTLPGAARVLVTPVDVPPAPRLALRDLAAQGGGQTPAVVGHGGQPGHPVLVTVAEVRRILGAGGTLRDVVGPQPRLVEAGTPDVLRNLNTPGEWTAWTGQPLPSHLPHASPDTAVVCRLCGAPVSRAALADLLEPIVGSAPADLRRAVEDILLDTAEEARWACGACIAAGRAIPANLKRQLHRHGSQWYMYVDRALRCADCRQPFTLTGREQQVWHEQYRMYLGDGPQSPDACLTCRQRRRQGRGEQRRLSERLADLDPSNPEQLREVAELYWALGVWEKAETFLRRARNRARDDAERAELGQLLAAWLAARAGQPG